MTNPVAPIPEGYHSITCFLAVADGEAAIDFYSEVFGAKVLSRADDAEGRPVHAELLIGDSTLQLGIPLADNSVRAPEGWVHTSIVHYCPDVDEAFARAVARGARVAEDVQTFVTGDRYGVVIDPFGHRWAVMTRVENVSREEADRRIAQWMAGSD
ncbi:VOC family protein [Nocardia rosealba]|uniref:VOC family protein n=1 Tax=Nocardia rosealba TaxID=2878563 RepID=UPI001CD965EF|nr:VOC family protein [Nocardia rosealba]MCA2211060.1 VOC family protein [Nocardia rosealba]